MSAVTRAELLAVLRECRDVLGEAERVLRREPEASIPMQRLRQRVRGLGERLRAELEERVNG